MPLLWAQAEFVKLATVSVTKRPIELLRAVESRYRFERPESRTWHWRRECSFDSLPAGCDLVIEAEQPFRVCWRFDNVDKENAEESRPIAFGVQGVRISARELRRLGQIDFEFISPQNAVTSEGIFRIFVTSDKPHRQRINSEHQTPSSAKNC
jgi:hypothetical protein